MIRAPFRSSFRRGGAAVLLLAVWGHGLAAAEPLPVALVNVDRVFKGHPPFQEQLEPLKAIAKELEQNVQLRQAELETVRKNLSEQQPGSPEFQRLQAQFVRLQLELQQYINTERQALQKKEADLYLVFYRKLDAAVTQYAKDHGLRLVIRQFESSLDDGQSLADILKTLNRQILFEDGLDITDEILKALNASGPRPAATSSQS